MRALEDLRDADFGDKRLTRRLLKVVEGLAPDPSASFPDAAQTDASLEGTYRFLNNEAVTPAAILAPHVAATVKRVREAGLAIVAHDTTELSFSTDREGAGPMDDGGRGFFAHFSLAIRADGSRRPLGVVGLRTFVRSDVRRRSHRTHLWPEEERESFRWKVAAKEVGALFPVDRVVHVMDSEADFFALLQLLVDEKRRFVIRLKYNRTVAEDAESPRRLDQKLEEKLDGLEGRLTREVTLASRTTRVAARKQTRRNATRQSRIAKLEFTATAVFLRAPDYLGPAPRLPVHVVHVREPNPPANCEPVDWKLITTEPIENAADIERIVDIYRARWVIEEFFKALKTGCGIEKRQLESVPALHNALAILAPIAWELLLLRSLARDDAHLPATEAFSPTKLQVLQRHKNTRLRRDASVRDAMLAVARLGGHITNNGEPGWLVLGRGYERLLVYEEGMLLAGKDLINP